MKQIDLLHVLSDKYNELFQLLFGAEINNGFQIVTAAFNIGTRNGNAIYHCVFYLW